MARKREKDEDATPALTEFTLTLPIGGGEQPGYQSQLVDGGELALDDLSGLHVNVNLGAKAAKAFVRVRNGLRACGASLEGGKPVWTNADALRYIFEAIAADAESEGNAG